MSTDNKARLQSEYNKTVGELRTLVDAVDAEKREFSADEQAQFDKINEALDAKTAQIRSLEALEAHEARADAARADLEKIARPAAEQRTENASDINEVREFLAGRGLSTRNFNLNEARDLTVGGATAGATTVPQGFVPELVATLQAETGVFKLNPNILYTDSGNTVKVPRVTGYTAVAQVAEASAVGSETDPAFSEASLGAFNFRGFTQISVELQQDNGVNLEEYIGQMLAAEAARGLDEQLVLGDGSTEPEGIFVGFSAAVTAATAGVTIDNLIDLVYSVHEGYRNANSAFIMKDSTAAVVRKLKDLDNNYLWQPSNQAGVPSTLLGYPVIADAFAPASTTGLKSVAFGDFKRAFTVRIVNNVAVQVSDQFAFSTGLVSYRLDLRADSAIVDSNGVKLIVQA